MIALFLCLMLAASVAAQLPGQPQEKKENSIPDAGTPGIEVKKDGFQNLPPALDKDKTQKISRYFDEALKNYGEILGAEKVSEVRTIDKRINNNTKLLQDHQHNLSKSESELRTLKMEYVKRYQALKSSYTKGYIDKNAYDTQLEKLAREYQFKVNSISGDREFYQDELGQTKTRLKKLQETNRINRMFLAKEEAAQLNSQGRKKQVTELEKLMHSIRKTGCFAVKNFCGSPEFK